jgi:hypothetical protein
MISSQVYLHCSLDLGGIVRVTCFKTLESGDGEMQHTMLMYIDCTLLNSMATKQSHTIDCYPKVAPLHVENVQILITLTQAKYIRIRSMY